MSEQSTNSEGIHQASLFDLQETTRPGNGAGPIVFVAYQDHGGEDMTPATQGGSLALFPDLDTARANAGALGVAAPVTWARAVELAHRHGLRIDDNLEPIGAILRSTGAQAGGRP